MSTHIISAEDIASYLHRALILAPYIGSFSLLSLDNTFSDLVFYFYVQGLQV